MFDKSADSVTAVFVQQGILGVLLLIALYTIYQIAREYNKLQDKRIEELKLSVVAIHDNTAALNELNRTIQSVLIMIKAT